MKIKCFRCEKEIDAPNSKNADYIIASDTIITEQREVLKALKEGTRFDEKKVKMAEVNEGRPRYPNLKVTDKDYDKVELEKYEDAKLVPRFFKLITEIEEKQIQKTGIICPKCYKKTDAVIWGIHAKIC